MLELSDGWKVQNSMLLPGKPEEIAGAGFDDGAWTRAVVPGTVLASYLKVGKVPDPFYSDQRFKISDEWFTNHDFWYRNTFVAPKEFAGKRIWLNFDGINWKADLFLNGKSAGRIDGAFIRGRFDVTAVARPGESNCLAVLIHKVANPGVMHTKSLTHWDPNGGALGLDSPTFLASVGWNWLPTIPGREIGIWNRVYLSATGEVSLVDPFVTSELSPDHSWADLTIRAEMRNHSQQTQHANLRGAIDGMRFSMPVELRGFETRTVVLDKRNCPELAIGHPRLWWPNGMGDPALYSLKLELDEAEQVSDSKTISFGVRKLEYKVHDNVLFIYVNGHRMLIRGGNWGMADGLLRCDREGYDLRVRLHRDMNLNMIRNWVGMTGNDEFYDACDKYGILVWDDFWLANPSDGPDPADHAMFIANARDKIRRLRNHPSLALYCGRNEGMPPPELDEAMRQATVELDGTRFYLSNSASGIVTGHGPYEMQEPEWYFANRGDTLHSELGIVAVPAVESMREMLPAQKLWPINDLWGLHDLSQARGPAYVAQINADYGPSNDAEEFCRKAQMVNMECSKAMFEAWRSKQGSGCLIWMTQSAWPSVICQAYDYYFEPTAAFFGLKKGAEAVHVFWDRGSGSIKVGNNSVDDLHGLTAYAAIYHLDGRLKWERSATVDVPAGSAIDCFSLAVPADISPVYFIRLKLIGKEKILSDNFYWTGKKGHDYSSLGSMPTVKLEGTAQEEVAGEERAIEVELNNPSSAVALMIRLKVVRADTGERALPVLYADNYFSLVPGESKRVKIEILKSDAGKDRVAVRMEGWNVPEINMALPSIGHSAK